MLSNNIKNHPFAIILFVITFLSLSYYPGHSEENEPIVDNCLIVYEGCFPHDANMKDEIERKNSVIAVISSGNTRLGTVESRDKNLRLIYVSKEGKSKTLWNYVDYGCVDKITFDKSSHVVRLYYDQTLFREKYYVTEFYIDTFKKEKILIKKGEWKIF